VVLVEMLQIGHDRALMRGQPGLLKMASLWPFVFGVLEQIAQRLVCSARQCGRSRNGRSGRGLQRNGAEASHRGGRYSHLHP
jgi:hypothetical protein